MTSGKALREVLPKLKEAANVEIVGMVITVDRMEKALDSDLSAVQSAARDFGVNVYSIVTINDIISAIENGVVEGKESYYDEDENKFYTKRDYVGNGLKVADKVKEGEEQTYSYYFFKIVYTAQDAYGNVATGESYDLVENDSYFELLIKVVEEEVETTSQDVWKIVLICVSVLAAAGIVAVIFINPDKKNKKSSHYTVTEE